jgi:hypothetical protein
MKGMNDVGGVEGVVDGEDGEEGKEMTVFGLQCVRRY